MMDLMSEALKRKRAKGIDLTIIVDGNEVPIEEDDKNSELAPGNPEESVEEEANPELLTAQGEYKNLLGEPMPESMPEEKPKSLMDKVKMGIMKKGIKK